MAEERSTLDMATDLLVYAPIGLAVRIKRVLPDLIDLGRSHAEMPVGMARTMGKAVMHQHPSGAKLHKLVETAEARLEPLTRKGSLLRDILEHEPSSMRSGRKSTRAGARSTGRRSSAATSGGTSTRNKADTRKAGSKKPSAKKPPDVGRLPIANYQTLSATQVIANLRGLSPADLRAIRDYEAATRSRRTVLDRIDSLLG